MTGFKEDTSRPMTLRETIHFYMIDYETPLGKAIDLFIIFLNILASALFVINTYPLSEGTRELLWRAELAVIGFFIIEYTLRLYGAYDRREYIRDPYSIIDLLAIAPTLIVLALPVAGTWIDVRFIQIIRVLSVFRIFRFLRFMSSGHRLFGLITLGMLNVVRLVVTILIIFFVSSGLFYFAESPVNPQIQNFGDAFYFTVVALSTVGFGDIVPVSGAGRLVTVLMIISGIILIPLQASQIIREWLTICKKQEVACTNCGLRFHDEDAAHCKNCGQSLSREGDRP